MPRDAAALLLDDASVADTVARLFKITDYLGLDHLGDAIADILNGRFYQAAKQFQETTRPKKLDGFIAGFFDTVPIAYSSASPSMEKLQKAFVKIFELTGFALLKDKRVREKLENIPQLSHDVLMSLVKSDNHFPSLVLFVNPPRCNGCRREMDEDFWPVKWIEKEEETVLNRQTNEWSGFGPAGYCEMCARIYGMVPDAFPRDMDW